ncbi:hypothetical protein N7462_002881 [Penicillium macrosclerotiorum]|uniref:uncharacterized protein n=1 Tax=Penicillium macrosclerotiorum TaxID=303699 RepID=UPI00254918BE|nr:uncharacterized protein N7462_002881 [Penicillium macrosclerotiorum]KAJ5693458.1 hypothetical protein N7462_002881 [Penicillium macrosclerotiorum]
MPGVPSSKGCDACRRVKKKCDERQPCSRCCRLQITCVGSGQQRFKFKYAESAMTKAVNTRSRPIRSAISVSRNAQNIQTLIQIQMPSNKLAMSLISTLDITDVRFDISYYGQFLKEIPKRVGTSLALDASVKAVVTAYPYFRHQNFSPAAYLEYCKSLRALRESLSDPIEARSTNTLCAVYLITICQSWLGKYDDQLKGHGEAISHLLRIADLQKCKSDFEKDIVITLTVPVILEAIVNPRIQMDSKWWEDVTQRYSMVPKAQIHGPPRCRATLGTLAKFPHWIRQPGSSVAEIAAVYIQMREDAQQMRRYLDQWPTADTSSFSDPQVVQHSRYQAGYTLAVTLALILNTLLLAFESSNAMLTWESISFCDEIIRQSEFACRYRPLGAAYISLCLVVGCAAAKDSQQLKRLQSLLADYQTDFKEINWIEHTAWLRMIFESHHVSLENKQDTVKGSQQHGWATPDNIWDENANRPESCCVM